jgi:hypothetical protein
MADLNESFYRDEVKRDFAITRPETILVNPIQGGETNEKANGPNL